MTLKSVIWLYTRMTCRPTMQYKCLGVMAVVSLGSAAQRLIRHYSVKPFDRAVVLAATPDAYHVALDLHEAGVDVAAIVDLRRDGEPSAVGRSPKWNINALTKVPV